MAGKTAAGHAVVVKPGRYPGTGTMAVVTGIGTRNMICPLAGRRGAVVAAETGAGRNPAVIKCRRNPAESRMTGFAVLAGADMTRRLAARPAAVVTTRAAPGYHVVIHADQRRPLLTGVTFLAQGHRLYMV